MVLAVVVVAFTTLKTQPFLLHAVMLPVVFLNNDDYELDGRVLGPTRGPKHRRHAGYM